MSARGMWLGSGWWAQVCKGWRIREAERELRLTERGEALFDGRVRDNHAGARARAAEATDIDAGGAWLR